MDWLLYNRDLRDKRVNAGLLLGSHVKVTQLKLNPFHANNLFLYHLKTSENQRFSDVFRGYKGRPVV